MLNRSLNLIFAAPLLTLATSVCAAVTDLPLKNPEINQRLVTIERTEDLIFLNLSNTAPVRAYKKKQTFLRKLNQVLFFGTPPTTTYDYTHAPAGYQFVALNVHGRLHSASPSPAGVFGETIFLIADSVDTDLLFEPTLKINSFQYDLRKYFDEGVRVYYITEMKASVADANSSDGRYRFVLKSNP